MKMVPYDLEKLERMFRPTKWFEVLNDFDNGDIDCVMITGYSNKNAKSCQSSIDAAIKRFKFTNIRVSKIKGDVFLIKKTAIEK